MKKLCLTFLLACGTLLSTPMAFAENVSGAYVSHYSGTAVILQIVRLSGKQIQGRAEQASVSADGQRLNTSNYFVSGAVSGETIVLSLKDAYSGSIIPMSGTLNGGDMQISGGHPDGSGTFTWILHRSSQSVFDRQVAALSAVANAGASRASAAKKLQDQIKADEHQRKVQIQSKKSFDSYCPYTAEIESKLEKIRGDFRKITVVMNEKLEKERATPPNSSENGYERNQILYSINDDWYGSNGVGYDFNDLSMDAHYANGTIDIRSSLGYAMKEDAFHGCGNGSTGFCAQVNEAFNRAAQCNTDLIAAFQKTNAVQNQERAKQKAIKQEAARLANLSQ
jgi:hypothetical protein